jgi:hypothetical protein
MSNRKTTDPQRLVFENLRRYRQLMDLMLREVVKGSPLLDMTDKTSVSLTLSRLAVGALYAEIDPMGRFADNDEVAPQDSIKPNLKLHTDA